MAEPSAPAADALRAFVDGLTGARLTVFLAIIGAMYGISAVSNDTYVAAFPAIAAALGVGEAALRATFGAFMLGLALGVLLVGPISDVFGRRPLIIAGIIAFIVASLGCALAPTIEVFFAFRILQGLASAAAIALCRAIVNDLFELRTAAGHLSVAAGLMATVPILGPLIGVAMLDLWGWRSIFLGIAGYGVLVLAAYSLVLPETQLYRRSASLTRSLARAFAAYGQVFVRPGPVGLVLCTAGCTGALIAAIAGVPFIYIEHFGLSEQLFALWYAANMVAFLIASITNSRLVGRHGPLLMARAGAVLALVSAAALCLAAVTGLGGFFGVAIPVVFVLAAVGLTSANAIALLGRAFPLNGGMAAAAMLATQFLAGTLLIELINYLPGAGAVPLALVILIGEVACVIGIFAMARDELAAPSAAQRI